MFYKPLLAQEIKIVITYEVEFKKISANRMTREIAQHLVASGERFAIIGHTDEGIHIIDRRPLLEKINHPIKKTRGVIYMLGADQYVVTAEKLAQLREGLPAKGYDYRQDQVQDVATVAEFLARYYRPERYTGRNQIKGWENYSAGLLASYEREFENNGFVFISHHDSITGQVVAFFGPAG